MKKKYLEVPKMGKSSKTDSRKDSFDYSSDVSTQLGDNDHHEVGSSNLSHKDQ
jgi:hypothetical protein